MSKPLKHALVFGGSRGIGAATVARLAQDGFRVSFTYVASADIAETLAGNIGRHGGSALPLQADSADPAAIRSAVAQAAVHFGPIDVVVVNAGLYRHNPIEAVSLEELDLMLAINVRGVFLSVQAALPQMRDGGRIVTIGSNVVEGTGSGGSSLYQMTKGAVAALVKGVALDVAPREITVNNIQPGPTETDITSAALNMLVQRSPLHRVARPEEIAGLIAYLARDEASYITGASLTIDGGFTL